MHIDIFCDGSCLKNPDGPGGWGLVLQLPDGREIHKSGAAGSTTNNRMEIQAAIEAILAARAIAKAGEPLSLSITSDSQYVINSITTWIRGWKKSNWRGSSGPVKNADLWRTLDTLAGQQPVQWHWVRGHNGHRENSLADTLAVTAARRQQGTMKRYNKDGVLEKENVMLETPPHSIAAAPAVLLIDAWLTDAELGRLVRNHMERATGKTLQIRLRS